MKTEICWSSEESAAVITALLEALQIMGQEHSDQTLRLMLTRLYQFKPEDIIASLRKCEMNCRKIYLADIVSNIPKPRTVQL